MTIEIEEFRCPSCGQQLGKQEYLHACEKLQEQLTERLQLKDAQFEAESKQRDARQAEEIK